MNSTKLGSAKGLYALYVVEFFTTGSLSRSVLSVQVSVQAESQSKYNSNSWIPTSGKILVHSYASSYEHKEGYFCL